MHRLVRLIPLALLPLFAACASTRQDASLFDDLGGRPGIEAIAEQLLVETSDDPRIAHHFRNANVIRLHEKLVEMICVEAGGPCTYTGAPMGEAHAGRGLTDADFNALVENLIDAMEVQQVPHRAQFRLLDRLARHHGEIIRTPQQGRAAPAGG